MPRRVVLESPYSGDVALNMNYLRAAMLDCLMRGDAPFASHLLYTQVLDDRIPKDRRLGMEAGFAWGEVAEACVVYTDLGISPGMREGINRAEQLGIPVEQRTLAGWRGTQLPDVLVPPPLGPRWTGVETDAPTMPAPPSAPAPKVGDNDTDEL